MEVSLTSPAEPPRGSFEFRDGRTSLPRILLDYYAILRAAWAFHLRAIRLYQTATDWRLEAASGTQGDVRKYASVCNFYPPSGGCTSYKSMYINILELSSFWS